ncbi:MAG: monovalent cation/H(+) antiporter subunit G [Bacillota bacterium]|nr:monovalent cation/H(+) antiporter subunit G [Bacillota bacterium]
MLIIRDIIVVIFLFGGLFFLTVGVIGMIRLPDVYNRLHALGKCDTLGSGLIIFGMIFLVPGMTNIVKLLLMGILTFTINPVITHLITKTAYVRGTALADDSFVVSTYYEEEEGEFFMGEGDK